MEQLILEGHNWAILFIIIAAFLDTFFLSGYILYGFALMAAVAVLHSMGAISPYEIAACAFTGTYTASITNYYIGTFFGQTTYIQKRLQGPRVNKVRTLLTHSGLFWYILATRFFTFTRPLYALLAGTLLVPNKKFIIYELIIAAVWTIFWTTILILGNEAIHQL